jgi:hypothetical protein
VQQLKILKGSDDGVWLSQLLDFELCPSSDILKNTEEPNVSETGSVSAFLRPLHLKTETDPFSETLCSLVSGPPPSLCDYALLAVPDCLLNIFKTMLHL